MNSIKKLIAMDCTPLEKRAKERGFQHLPIRELKELCEADGVDVVEMLGTIIEKQPLNDSPEEIARVRTNYVNKRLAMQLNGMNVIECPTKRSASSPSGFKQSDDIRLMLTTITMALKLRPDFVLLFAADGDFAPMVELLRNEGIRTEVVAPLDMLATDLRRYASNVVDFDALLDSIPH